MMCKLNGSGYEKLTFSTNILLYFPNGTVIVKTSSSAVAKRPRDASCLSVVSFNSTKRRRESFIVSYIR